MSKHEVGRECRFVIPIPKRSHDQDDVHMVKEQIHYDDGSMEPHIRFIKNYKRPFWVTQAKYRNHQDKKEWEDIDRLDRYESTESDLAMTISRVLGQSWKRPNIRELSSSPYLYGSGVSAATLIRHQYQVRYPDLLTPYSVAFIDIETDVLYGTQSVIIATISFQNHIYTAVDKSFLSGIADPQGQIDTMTERYIGEDIRRYGYQCEVRLCDTELDVITSVIQKAHEWQPDFLTAWNIDFDFPTMFKGLKRANVDPIDVFSDPRVPKGYRLFKYIQGKKKNVKANGDITPIMPADQWHNLISTSSFFVIDAMCVYRRLRIDKQKEPKYKLDWILNKELGTRKLSFKATEQYEGTLKWHQVMQRDYKIEYIVYNRYDSISMRELNDKTRDLSYTLPSFVAATEFTNTKYVTKRIADALYFYCLEHRKVTGTVGEIEDDDDDETLNLRGWIK